MDDKDFWGTRDTVEAMAHGGTARLTKLASKLEREGIEAWVVGSSIAKKTSMLYVRKPSADEARRLLSGWTHQDNLVREDYSPYAFCVVCDMAIGYGHSYCPVCGGFTGDAHGM